MKRILHVVGGMNQGGTENFIMNLYRNIDRSKLQFDFLVNRNGFFDDEILKMGGKIYHIPALQKIGYYRYIKKLDEFLKEHNTDYRIIHSHINKVSGLILERAKKANIPIRIAHSHGSSLAANYIVRIYKEWLGRKIKNNATHLFACSNDAAKFLFNDNYDMSYIIYNGVDSKKFHYSEKDREEIRKKYNIEDDCLVIGNIARFNIQKNHEFLIEVFYNYVKKNPNSRLMLIGEGELENSIRKKVNDYKINDKVIFIGITGTPNKYYSAFDSFILPSLSEGLGIVLIEAQLSGLKCIASKEGVPIEAKISHNLSFISLKDSIDIWINNICKSNNRKSIKISNNYDIKELANKLSDFYISEDNNFLKEFKINEKN